jgi:hypothetical protein
LVSSDFWLFAALQQHLKGINFICDEVPAATRKWYREVPEEFYSNLLENLFFFFLQLRYIELWRLNGKLRCRNKVHIMSCILCFVSFQYHVQEQRYKHGGITLSTLRCLSNISDNDEKVKCEKEMMYRFLNPMLLWCAKFNIKVAQNILCYF